MTPNPKPRLNLFLHKPRRKGDAAMLRTLANERGIGVRVVDLKKSDALEVKFLGCLMEYESEKKTQHDMETTM